MQPKSSKTFKIKKFYISDKWKPLLCQAGLADPQSFALQKFDWFEEPNERRGGKSGVCRIVLNPDFPREAQKAVFFKIQQNYSFRAFNKFFTKQLTFVREFEANRKVAAILPHTPEILLFCTWKSGRDKWAALITKELASWIQLAGWLKGENGIEPPHEQIFLKILGAAAETSRRLNDAGWVHMGFSAKHIFIRPGADNSFETCVIDFEKCRKHPNPAYRTLKDCSHFMRHTPGICDEHKLYYLKAYFKTESFTRAQLRLIKKMPGAPDF
jgi:hypothetical protein